MKGKIPTTYGTIARRETSRIFFERFLGIIEKNLVKFFGEAESRRVLKILKKGQLRIVSPENFLYCGTDISDKSLEIYNTSKTVEEFFYKSMLYFKERAENGETDIEIREFFLALVDILALQKYNSISDEDLGKYMRMLFTTLTNITHQSPFVVRILEPRLMSVVKESTELSTQCYNQVIRVFFTVFKEFITGQDSILSSKLYLPRIEIMYPVFHDARRNQEFYLASIYGVQQTHTKALLKQVENPTESSAALDIVLDILENETQKHLNRESIMLEMKRIQDESPFRTYPTLREFSAIYNRMGIPKSLFNNTRVARVCTNEELFKKCLRPYFCDIEIDCKNLKMQGINMYIDAAKTLSVLKSYYYSYIKKQEEKKRVPYHKITLLNVKELTQEFIGFLNKKARQLKSVTGREFIFEVRYLPKVAAKKFGKTTEPYFRVISDIHADYNKSHKYSYNFQTDFVLNCGDTAADYETCIQWNRTHIMQGVCVAGNHLGYSSKDGTKSYQLHKLGSNLTSIDRRVLFLSNSVAEYEGVIILGTTLYTDFALYGDEHVEEAMQYAKKYMNDFRLIQVPGHREYTREEGTWKVKKLQRGEGEVRLLTPQDHAYYFHYSYNFLKEKVLEYSHKPIVIITHHAPTPYAISPEYTGSMLNPAFASNLNNFIIKHPQIRLWCYGHCHSPADFILGQTRLVCNPFGYNNENNADLPYNYGTRIKVADVRNKKPWTSICAEEIKFGLIKVYEK